MDDRAIRRADRPMASATGVQRRAMVALTYLLACVLPEADVSSAPVDPEQEHPPVVCHGTPLVARSASAGAASWHRTGIVEGGVLLGGGLLLTLGSLLPVARKRRGRFQVRARDAAIDSLGDGMFHVDVGGRVVFASASAARLLMSERGDMEGGDLHALLHAPHLVGATCEPDGCRLLADLRGAVTTGGVRGVFRRGDGTPLQVEYRIAHLIDGGRLEGATLSFSDVGDRVAMEESCRASAAELQSIFDGASVGIVLTDTAGTILRANPAFQEMLGSTETALIGRAAASLAARDEPADRAEEMRLLIQEVTTGSASGRTLERRLARADGSSVWVRVSLSHSNAREPSRGFVSIVQDITGEKRIEEELRHRAFHDPLTSLPNRAHLFDRLRYLLPNLARQHARAALLYLDLDQFKQVNDAHGHQVGDELLVGIANRLLDAASPSWSVARLAGDEFVVLLQPIGEEQEALLAAKRIRLAIGAPIKVGGRTFFPSVSIGIAMTSGRDDAVDLLRYADLAMFEAKRQGRAGIEFFREELSRRLHERVDLENELRLALRRGDFHLEYQPIVDARSRRIAGFEALMRWDHRDHGPIPPTSFIPLAEETGLIVPMGRWALERACRDAVEWAAGESGVAPYVSVNVSGHQLQTVDFAAQVEGALRASGLSSQRLSLEITESVLMNDVEATRRRLAELGWVGVQIAIDDFGTGYSSLSYLRELPVHRLKIDRSFVAAVSGDASAAALVRAIVNLAQALDLRTVAEGVEREEQVEALAALGCDFAQGYLFSRAMRAAEVPRLLSRNRLGRVA